MNKINQRTDVSIHAPEVDRIFTVHHSHISADTFFGTIILDSGAGATVTMTYETPEQIRAHARELEALAVLLEQEQAK